MEMKNKTNDLREENYFAEDKTKPITILAVDLGITTGWAISNEFGITSGSISFKSPGYDNEADSLALIHFAMQQLSSAIKRSGGKL